MRHVFQDHLELLAATLGANVGPLAIVGMIESLERHGLDDRQVERACQTAADTLKFWPKPMELAALAPAKDKKAYLPPPKRSPEEIAELKQILGSVGIPKQLAESGGSLEAEETEGGAT